MRLVFAGTPAFAAQALSALHAAGHEIALVLTQPDRPAGRGLRSSESAVKRLAVAHGLAVFQPESLEDAGAQERIAAAHPDALVVAAYGLLLPLQVLQIAPRGAINIHASLLPRWRGAAPVQRALLAGDRETGISIMQMDAGLDTGPVLAQVRLPIAAADDAGTLHDKLAGLGATAIVETLATLGAGRASPAPQDSALATYASKLGATETVMDWHLGSEELERRVRALRPAPGAQSSLRGVSLKLWRAERAAGDGEPGVVLDAGAGGVLVACGTGALRVTELQRAGGRRLAAAEFLRGFSLARGERLGAAR